MAGPVVFPAGFNFTGNGPLLCHRGRKVGFPGRQLVFRDRRYRYRAFCYPVLPTPGFRRGDIWPGVCGIGNLGRAGCRDRLLAAGLPPDVPGRNTAADVSDLAIPA
ncbi:hypothetical protein D3C71_1795050 [compost metagenome]